MPQEEQTYNIHYQAEEIETLLDKIHDLGNASSSEAGLMSSADKTKLDGIASGAQTNVLEGVKLGDTALVPTEKVVTIPVDSTPTASSNNPISSGGVKTALDNLNAGVMTFAGNLVDTRSAGTRQGPFAFRQSGGDGVNYMRKILGRTEAFNQLVGPSDTQVTIPSGHLYYALINGTASVGTSDGTPISVTGGTDIVVDLTLEGLGLTTADQFRALHPLPYYNYNAGVLKNNAATGLETTCIGANKYDGRIGVADAYLDPNGAEHSGPSNDITPYLPVFPSLGYFITSANGGAMGNWASYCWYDSNKAFISGSPFSGATKVHITAPATAAFVRFTTTKANGGYYFGIDTGVEVFEPCKTKTLTLGLNSIPCHDENNNAVVVNGLDGVGSSQDELIVENGWGAKIIKRRGRRAYQAGDESDATLMTDGTNTDYPLATPKVLTLDNPIPALIEVDNLGTEKRLPEDTADNPQAPFECDSNYSISTANLVRKLNS